MPPNNPMTEGEALAVAQEAYDAARVGGNHEHDALTFAVRALTAHTAASAGEAYPEAVEVCFEAYQVVGSLLSDLGAFDTPEAEKILDNLSQHALVHKDVLPWPSFEKHAAVPADALERLVEELREKVRNELGQGPSGNATLYCAGRIAALIPKGADHEQR